MFQYPGALCDPASERGRDIYEFISDDEAAAAFAAQSQRLAFLEHQLRLATARWRATPANQVFMPLHRYLLRAFVEEEATQRPDNRVVEKTPLHVLHLDEIFQTFPRASALVTIRHPVDVLASRRKRAADPARVESLGDWLYVSPIDFSRAYRREAAAALGGLVARPGRVRLIRYEDLTANPLETLESIFAWLHAPFDPDVYDAAVDAGAIRNERPIEADTMDWREFLGEEDVEVIERETALEMRLLGYQPKLI